MPAPPDSLYIGEVFHERHMPFNHKLRYRVFTLWINIDDIEKTASRLKWFSFGRFNILGVHNRDHARRDGSAIRPWIEDIARAKGIDIGDGAIYMLGFPRLWGYVFNPLTLFFCYDAGNVLKAIIHQVKNTFGEQHAYVLPVIQDSKKIIDQSCEKVFHVSPFIHMDCTYHFKIREPDEKLAVAIHQYTPAGKILTATWAGQRIDLNDKNIIYAVLRNPLMTIKVIAGIHWEAIKLIIKGARYIKKPAPPGQSWS